MTDEKKEEEEKPGASGMLAGLLGMGTSVAGMIPSLLKGPQQNELRRMQAGQGAGASLARQTASRAAGAVTGASTAQPSSGRGGNLREGLRAADQIVQRGAQQASITGARESLAATQMLRQNDLARRGAFRTLGAGVGQGLAGIGSVLAAARDQGPVSAAQGPVEDALGVGAAAALPGGDAGPVPTETELNIGEFGAAQTRLQDTAQGPYKQAIDRKSDAMQERGRLTAGGLGGTGGPPAADSVRQGIKRVIDPQAQEDKALSGLADETAKRQQAELGYMMTASTPEAEAFRTMRKQQEEWLYYQAMNYDPMAVGSQRGIDPRDAVGMLQDSGYEPDMSRLGIEGGDGKR